MDSERCGFERRIAVVGAEKMNVEGWRRDWLGAESGKSGIGLGGGAEPMANGGFVLGRSMPMSFLYMSRMTEHVVACTAKKSGVKGSSSANGHFHDEDLRLTKFRKTR